MGATHSVPVRDGGDARAGGGSGGGGALGTAATTASAAVSSASPRSPSSTSVTSAHDGGGSWRPSTPSHSLPSSHARRRVPLLVAAAPTAGEAKGSADVEQPQAVSAPRSQESAQAQGHGVPTGWSAPPPPPPPPSSSSWWWKALERTELPNPGAYEEINQEATTILRPNLFDGVRFDMNTPLTQTLSLGHSIEMGSAQATPGYALSANYMSNTFVAMSRVDMQGRFNGRLFYTHTPNMVSKLLVSRQPEEGSSANAMWDMDYRGGDFSGNVKLGVGGIAAVSYMQSITPALSMGGEGFFQRRNKFSALTAAARYVANDGILTATVASFGPVITSYVHRVNPRVSLAAELFWDLRSRDSYVTAGYKFDLRNASVVGQVSSTGKVAATLEEKLNPGVSFLLSGEVDHVQKQYKFGFGLNIGS